MIVDIDGLVADPVHMINLCEHEGSRNILCFLINKTANEKKNESNKQIKLPRR